MTTVPKDDPYRYRMDFEKRGTFIIINNKKFRSMPERNGTDVDAASLYMLFKELGFDVQLKQDLTNSAMLQLMSTEANKDHSNCDCFGVAILSHGDDGIVYGVDALKVGDGIIVENLVAPIKFSPSLIGKPKLFFIQACRGSVVDDGVEAPKEDWPTKDDTTGHDDEAMDTGATTRIPIEADFLYAYATPPGYYSWRSSSKGTYYVQALCEKLRQMAATKEICTILTHVNGHVAERFLSHVPDEPAMNRKKQIPSYVSMLRKELYLVPKLQRR